MKGRDAFIIVLALLVVGAICLVGLNAKKQSTPPAPIVDTQNVETTTTITFSGTEFNPAQTRIAAGSQLKFTNNSKQNLTIDSENKEFGIIGTIKPGESKAFYFSQKGTWSFHNTANEKQTGTLVIL